MSKEDLPNVQRLYEKATENRIASAVRDDTVWNWLIGPGAKTWLFSSPKVILDQRGRFCGYVTIAHGNECGFREVIVKQDEESCRVALGAIVREAKRREAKEISFWRLPWDDPLAVFLRQHVDCEFAIRTGSTGGPLMLIVNFPALMQKLEPLFTKRWTETGTHRAGTRFTLTTESGAVGFKLTKNAVRTGGPGAGSRVRVPRRWLSGLLTGYYSVEEIAPRKGVVIPPEVKPALDILFPKGWPFVYQGDDY